MHTNQWIISGLIGLLAASATATPRPTTATQCDRACLVETIESLQNNLLNERLKIHAIAPNAEVRENAKLISLEQSVWARVKSIRSSMVFADPATGNVLSRSGVELKNGNAAYISTRLKVLGNRRIVDVEIAADTSEKVVPTYIFALDPMFESIIPPEKRTSRVALEALVRRYFNTLSTHVAVRDDIDDAVCNRFHSGQQITNVVRNSVEGGPARTCVSANEGNPPWGPATQQRIPVIDETRGIVVGITLLHYLKMPDQPTMYVTEVFKIVGGKIVRIDNIGLMQKGVDGLGFVH